MRKFTMMFRNHFQAGLSMMVIAMAPGVFDSGLFEDAED